MPTAAELVGTGYTVADFEAEPVDVWPENWRAFCLFADLQTQWRVAGMGGVSGLDYNVLFHKMDRMNLSVEDYDQLEADVRVMELEALSEINKTK